VAILEKLKQRFDQKKAAQRADQPDVSDGSIATETGCPRHVRFPPASRDVSNVPTTDSCIAANSNFYCRTDASASWQSP
jgi:hypothetical protein